MGEPKYITLHHDGINRPTTLNEIDRYHRDSCKWERFAYHYYISENKIYKCRDEHQIGTRKERQRRQYQGYVFTEILTKRPTLKQQILIIVLINKLCYQYKIKKRKHQTASRLGTKQNIVVAERILILMAMKE